MLDDRDVAKPPYDEGPNKDELPDKPVSTDKLVEILKDILKEKKRQNEKR